MYTDNYKTIFLDFDGVIANSNYLKHRNIYLATSEVVGKAVATTFAKYFTERNGVPREIKIFEYFTVTDTAASILAKYNEYNKNLIDAEVAPDIIDFIHYFKKATFYILSGGIPEEIIPFLKKNIIYAYFSGILTGPSTKSQNLKNLNFEYPAMFVGDSSHDYQIARSFGLKFVFMTQWTEDLNLAEDNSSNFTVARNFRQLMERICKN